MCIYGEYGICSICPQEECPTKEKKEMINAIGIKGIIYALVCIGFIGTIIGTAIYANVIDYLEKHPKKIKHENIDLEKWRIFFENCTNTSFTHEEIEKITDYLKQNKKSVIKEINEL